MEIFLNILTALLIVSVSALCIYIIFFLKNTTKTLENLQSDIHRLADKADPVLSKLDSVSDNISFIIDEIKDHALAFGDVLDQAKEKAEILLNIDKKIKTSIENSPIADLYRRLNGISKGVSAFWDSYKRK